VMLFLCINEEDNGNFIPLFFLFKLIT